MLAKWLPSVNASSAQTRITAKKLVKLLGMTEKDYRQTLSELRRYTDIIENRLRVSDYTFDYEKQPSCAMMKYRRAFIRNDGIRYTEYLRAVDRGEAKLNTSILYPYEIVRRCLDAKLSKAERLSLDTTWRNLPDFGNNTENAIAVVDGSGSMTCGRGIRPIDAALSLGIYFAQHNKGKFANHFITFSKHPRLVEIKGKNIVDQVQFCNTFNEVANTDIEAVFDLILRTAVKNKVSAEELEGIIKKDLYHHQGAMPNNFLATIPDYKQAYRAIKMFKDEYLLDFVNVEELGMHEEDVDERVIEQSIVHNIKNFIMTFGKGFTFNGSQVHYDKLGHDHWIDLLFYNRDLRRLVVFEKIVKAYENYEAKENHSVKNKNRKMGARENSSRS